MLIYLAGPYSGKDYSEISDNIDTARQIAIKLWEKGHAVITPHLNTAHFEVDCECNYEDYMRGDLMIIARCDAMVMLPGWTQSKGACREEEYAKSLGVPVYLWTDLPELHLTEVNSPIQCKAFAENLGIMYRLHLSKNADYCVHPDTLVLTADFRWVPIAALAVGDRLIGFTENANFDEKRKFEESVVLSTKRVNLPSYKLTLEDGSELISSAEHPWLVMNGNSGRWCLTKDLQESARYSIPSRIARLFNLWEFDNSRDAGYLAAALDGEGWLTHKENPSNDRRGHDNWVFTLGFSQRDNEMLAEVERILRDRGITYRRKFSGSTEQIVWSKRNQIVELLGSIRPPRLLPHMLPNLGRIRHFPTVVKNKLFIGDVDLISIQTSTKTFIANGFAAHNSPANVAGPGELGLATRLWDKATRLMNLIGFKVYTRTNDVPKTFWQKFWYFVQGRVVVIDEVIYTEPRVPKHESIEDTLNDNSVYSLIFKLFREGKWGK